MLKVTTVLAAATSQVAAFAVGGSSIRTMSRSSDASMAFYDYKATTIDGKEMSMSDLKGKPVLILNVASL